MDRVILIVEDDHRNLKLIRDLLQIRGYTTLEATDGKQGVDMARAKMPDLILMDIQMPIMDGFKATSILKADPVTKSITIVALTASAMQGDREKCIEAGFNDYITKPLDTRAFMTKIKEYLGK
ncbi:MAG: response regulator [Spirochaetales bacterium]|jgi:two-component system cell cycle response regulator DivK|nr:response regulator [Spirochaetales bacterium]